MTGMTVLVPSRGRPGNIRRLIDAWADTTTGDTLLHVVADHDDPHLSEYQAIPDASFWMLAVQSKHQGLARVLNAAAVVAAEHTLIVGNMGDDHVPRTVGWDTLIIDALQHPGMAYGDDLLQGERLPTAAFLTSDIVRCLGFYCPPGPKHLYIDDAWLTIGRATRCVYLPGVVIEHMHPHAGKADSDAGYESANDPLAESADREAWGRYLAESWPHDLRKLQQAGLAWIGPN